MLSIDAVKKVSKLAKFNLTDEELKTFRKLLSEALDYIEILNELDTSDTEPTSQVTGLNNIFGEDLSSQSLDSKDALKNAPKVKRDLIVTDAVITKGSANS